MLIVYCEAGCLVHASKCDACTVQYCFSVMHNWLPVLGDTATYFHVITVSDGNLSDVRF